MLVCREAEHTWIVGPNRPINTILSKIQDCSAAIIGLITIYCNIRQPLLQHSMHGELIMQLIVTRISQTSRFQTFTYILEFLMTQTLMGL